MPLITSRSINQSKKRGPWPRQVGHNLKHSNLMVVDLRSQLRIETTKRLVIRSLSSSSIVPSTPPRTYRMRRIGECLVMITDLYIYDRPLLMHYSLFLSLNLSLFLYTHRSLAFPSISIFPSNRLWWMLT